MPKPVNRFVITRGPAAIKFKGAVIFSAEPIVLEFEQSEGVVESDAYGPLFSFPLDAKPKLSLKPVGEIEHFDILYNFYASMIPGTSIFGDADTPLEICPLDTSSQKIVFHAAGIKGLPNLSFTGKGVLYDGNIEFAFVRKNNTLPQADDAFYYFADNDYDGTGLDVDKILVQSYDVRWLSGGTYYLFTGAPQTSGTLTVGNRYRIADYRRGDKFGNVGATSNIVGHTFVATATTPTEWTKGSVLLDVTGQKSGSLVIGKRYLIAAAAVGDDFSNVGATAHTAGHTFVASGTTPTDWSNSSELIEVTADLDWNATAAEVDTALSALASVTALTGVVVAGNVETGYDIVFDDVGAAPWVTGDVVGMPGGTYVEHTVTVQGDGSTAQAVHLSLAPWSLFPSREGIKVEFSIETTEDEADSVGRYDEVFRSLSVSAKLLPMNVSAEVLMAAANVQGPRATRGRRNTGDTHQLVIKGEGLYCTLYGAVVTNPGLEFSSINQRIRESTWTAGRTITGGGVPQALFNITTVEPAIE